MVNADVLQGKRVLVTGGTGSLGSTLIRRLLQGDLGRPETITIFSRDEAKQHEMRLTLDKRAAATDEVVFDDWKHIVRFQIGDVADEASVRTALRETHVVFNAAALKQVPTCEYFPLQAVRTNILGPEQIVRAIRELGLPVETVVGISTDKACKPVNVMGMTKAIQERVFIQANLDCVPTRFVAARYGNVLASRGSVIPLFHEQIRGGGPVTLTTPEMTRFLMTLDQAVDTVFAALREARPGEIYVPRVPSAKMTDLAAALIDGRQIETVITGIRPGEKVHEILVSEEEAYRTVSRDNYLAIKPMLPELDSESEALGLPVDQPFSSADNLLDVDGVRAVLERNGLLVDQTAHRGLKLMHA
jgi:FlaA1/EpsC-like NDP-sugar epimerase